MKRTERCTPLPGSRYNELDGTQWPWGPIKKVHYIGENTAVVEYQWDMSTRGLVTKDQAAEHGATKYQPFIMIDGHGWYDVCQYFPSLDSAIVGAISFRRCGEDSQAALMFDRMTLADNPENFHEVELAQTKARNREQAAARIAAKAAAQSQ